MKRWKRNMIVLGAILAMVVLCILGACGIDATAQEVVDVPAVEASAVAEVDDGPMVFFGARMHTDAAFYAQLGIKTDEWDATVGIGFNDSVWIGAHKYVFGGDGLAASIFAGIEMHIVDEDDGMTMDPAMVIGGAINEGPILFIVEALIVPVAEGEPVQTVFAMSVNFGWGF